MKALIAILILSAVTFAAPADTKKKSTKTAAKTAAPKTNVVQPTVIPKDATPNSDGSYSYTDKDGKKWVYNKTPFGISKMQDMGSAGAVGAAAPKAQYVKAFDNGDTVRFERQTPFGTTKWEKKKSELTDEERTVLNQTQSAKTSDPKPE